MRLSSFIVRHLDQILEAWDECARTMTPAADSMTLAALRDDAEEMLREVAADIESPQTASEQHSKSLGGEDDVDSTSAASHHGRLRHAADFSLLQVSSEFRALRASVLQLWLKRVDAMSEDVLTDLMRFNEAIDRALAESIVTFTEREGNARDIFDAILGHDLRGPLSSMTMAGNMLTRTELPASKVAELGRHVERSARYMTSMVNDLLDFSGNRLGAAHMPVNLQPADLSEICADAIADARAMHPESDFELEAEARLDARVDPDRVHQLLVNLLGNAGQHGARGRPIRMRVEGDEDEVVLSVINEGAQIAEDALQRIFEPMTRLAPGDKASGRSLGLGLHVAREIALAHGGCIRASSDPQHTTFAVRLPRRARLKGSGNNSV